MKLEGREWRETDGENDDRGIRGMREMRREMGEVRFLLKSY